MTKRILAIVLAAGEGTRMRSTLPKVLHEVAGQAMVCHVLDAVGGAGCNDIALVVGNGADAVSDTAARSFERLYTFLQTERLGTAHAVLAARNAIMSEYDQIIIGYGDTPLVTADLFLSILNELDEGADIAVLGFHTDSPTGYGRLLTEGEQLVAIREEKDANDLERQVTLCNSGIMGLNGHKALSLLEAVDNKNAKSEYYLTDVVGIAHQKGLDVRAVVGEEEDTLGVNNRVELAEAERIYQRRKREELMLHGVTMIEPDSVHVSFDTEIGQDTIVEPNCFFAPGVSIASNVRIKANCYFEGDLKKNQRVSVASGATIGPFARLRPGADLRENTKVGNFCEVKNATLGKGSKVNHLTYIGDSIIGEDANIGAGTITCNYDGFSKFQTIVGAGAFVGSNSSLVAPVKIGDGAYIASGSVITDDVGEDALAIGRGRQDQKEGWAAEFRAKNKTR